MFFRVSRFQMMFINVNCHFLLSKIEEYKKNNQSKLKSNNKLMTKNSVNRFDNRNTNYKFNK